MKTMTCKQLGGACDKTFSGNSFEDIAEQSRQHGMQMFQQGDQQHLNAMNDMREQMKDGKAMQAWMDQKRKEFESLPESNLL
jgi:hypothetical protein